MSKKQQQAAIDEWKKANQSGIADDQTSEEPGAAAMKFEPHESSSGGLPSAEDKWG